MAPRSRLILLPWQDVPEGWTGWVLALARAWVKALGVGDRDRVVCRSLAEAEDLRATGLAATTYDAMLGCQPPDGDPTVHPLWQAARLIQEWHSQLDCPGQCSLAPSLPPLQQAAQMASTESAEVLNHCLYALGIAERLPAGDHICIPVWGSLEAAGLRALGREHHVSVLPLAPDATTCFYRFHLPRKVRQEAVETGLTSRGTDRTMVPRPESVLFFSSYRNFSAALSPIARHMQAQGSPVLFVTTPRMRRGLRLEGVAGPVNQAGIQEHRDLGELLATVRSASGEGLSGELQVQLQGAARALLQIVARHCLRERSGGDPGQVAAALSTAVERVLVQLMTDHLTRAEAIHRLVRHLQPRALVMCGDWFHWGPGLILAGRKEGIPVISVQDGLILESPWTCRVLSDLHLVCGERDRAVLRAWGVPDARVRVVGQPRYDDLDLSPRQPSPSLRQELGMPQGARLVLVLDTNERPSRWGPYLESLGQVASAANLVVVLKLHPQAHVTVTAASLVGESLAAQGRLKVVRDVPLAPLIQASDVAVSSVSTALVEALLCGRPCFSADGLRMPHCRNPFTDLRGVGVVATPAEFVESVMRLLDGRRTTALLEGRWDASDFFHELDGQAAARAAAAIEAAATVGAGGAA